MSTRLLFPVSHGTVAGTEESHPLTTSTAPPAPSLPPAPLAQRSLHTCHGTLVEGHSLLRTLWQQQHLDRPAHLPASTHIPLPRWPRSSLLVLGPHPPRILLSGRMCYRYRVPPPFRGPSYGLGNVTLPTTWSTRDMMGNTTSSSCPLQSCPLTESPLRGPFSCSLQDSMTCWTEGCHDVLR